MQIEKVWSGLPAPRSVTDKVRRVKDTYTDDAVTFEKEKREEKKGAFAQREEAEAEPSPDDQAKEKSEPKVHVDVTV